MLSGRRAVKILYCGIPSGTDYVLARLSYLSLYVHKSVIIIKNVVFVEWIAEHQSKARLVHRLRFMCSR